MVIVTGFIRVRDSDVARLNSALTEMSITTRAQDGCEHYSLAIDIVEPSVIRISERWRDRAAQALHLVSDHMVGFNMAMQRGSVIEAIINAYDDDGSVRNLMNIKR